MKVYAVFTVILFWTAGVLTASVGKPLCGGSSSSKDIQLISPNIPPRECEYKINAYSSYVCQLRIDLEYILAQPSLPSEHNKLKFAICDQDFFEAGNVKLCGIESSQHIYLPFNRTAGMTSMDLKIMLAHRLGNFDLPTPSWNIHITQLECPAGASVRSLPEGRDIESRASSIKDGFFVAPPGCLQYFPHPTGTVTSFNFNDGNGIYPGNMNYAICFRRTSETKALSIYNNFFKLGADDNDFEVDQYCYGNKNVNSDYLMIPQGELETSGYRATYFCGDVIQDEEVISTEPGPLMVIFNSDAIYVKEAGFSFQYNVVS